MIREMLENECKAAAFYHSRLCGLPRELQETAADIYRAIYRCPSAKVFLNVDENGRICGLCLAASDRRRLLSELYSYIPLQITACILKKRTLAKELLRLFGSALNLSGCTAEILVLNDELGDIANMETMLIMSKAFLASRGASQVYISDDRPEVANLLASHGFVSMSAAELKKLGQEPFSVEQAAEKPCYRAEVEGDTNFIPGPFTFTDRLRCLCRWELMVVFPIYTMVLIPFASFLAYKAKTVLDPWFNLPPIADTPSIPLILFCLISGGLLLVYSYSYLILEGEGGPVPPWSAKTKRLVVTGPYRYVRHPSILAKLIGVISLGIAFNTWSFLLVVIPLLMVWSITWNGVRQDGDLIHVFGDEYIKYRDRVPMLIPNFFPKDGQ